MSNLDLNYQPLPRDLLSGNEIASDSEGNIGSAASTPGKERATVKNTGKERTTVKKGRYICLI
jgi:hypothetical protein